MPNFESDNECNLGHSGDITSQAVGTSDTSPFLVTYLLVLPDPLPVPQGTTWMHELDDEEPLLDGVQIAPVIGLEPISSKGNNFVSLRFWQLCDEKALPSELHYGGILASRVLAVLTDIDEAVPLSSEVEGSSEQPFRTVVEAVTFVSSNVDHGTNNGKPDPLSRCIEVLLAFHRAYRLATQKRVRALTYERLHPVVYWTKRGIEPEAKHEPMGIQLLGNQNFDIPETDEVLSEHFDAISQYYVRGSVNDPFTIFAERRLEAQIELWSVGEIAKSVVETAIAAEVLFDTVLGLMMWEEGASIESAAEIFSRDVTPRLKSQYSGRLGGNWTFKASPLKDWYEQIAQPRNRVVHAGYQPTKNEGADALSALERLEHFIGDRLAEKSAKYPRTGWLFLGSEGFKRRGMLKSRTAWLNHNGDDVRGWLLEYSSWRESVNTCIFRRRSED